MFSCTQHKELAVSVQGLASTLYFLTPDRYTLAPKATERSF